MVDHRSMFFYLSFLRPPPIQAPPSSPILITPQISNDLRTEPYDSEQDLYYAWIQEPQPGQPTLKPQQQSPSTSKLTTYRIATAYKEIPVPLPKGLREGEKWRLALTTKSCTAPLDCAIPFGEKGIGAGAPFPVFSMPVLFTAKSSKWAPKQEQIERIYRFTITRPLLDSEAADGSTASRVQQVSLRIREHTSFDLDKKIWDSGIGLSSWLVQMAEDDIGINPVQNQPGVDALERLKDIVSSGTSKRILELGAGTGIVSIVLAVLRDTLNRSEEKDEILATDLESAIPVLEHAILSNKWAYPTISLKAGVLDWDVDLCSQIGGTKFDLVVMADVTYNTSSFPALVQTLQNVVKVNAEYRPLFLMGYKQRDEAERSLWDLAKKVGLNFVQIGEVPGYGDAPVEIWIA